MSFSSVRSFIHSFTYFLFYCLWCWEFALFNLPCFIYIVIHCRRHLVEVDMSLVLNATLEWDDDFWLWIFLFSALLMWRIIFPLCFHTIVILFLANIATLTSPTSNTSFFQLYYVKPKVFFLFYSTFLLMKDKWQYTNE